MLFNERHEIVQMLPPKDCTNNIYSVWADLSHWHHGTFFCWVGQHQNNVTFAFRKGRKSVMLANRESKQGHTAVAPLQIPRWWYNRNSDDTSTTHFTLNDSRPSTDSTIGSTAIMAGPGRGYDDLGSKGELYVVEVDNTQLGEDSNGNYYDMVQIVVNPAFGAPPKSRYSRAVLHKDSE